MTQSVTRIFVCVIFLIGIAAESRGQVATALLREGEALPGDMLGTSVSGISNSATNAVGGYAFTVTTDGSFSNVWGNLTGGPGTVLRAETTIGDLEITAIESFFGISDSGQICYGTTSENSMTGGTGLDGVFRDDKLILNEEDPVAALPGQFSTFNSRPGITVDGNPYWVGGISTVQGGGSQNRVLFFGTDATPVLMSGDTIIGVPELASMGSAIDFDVRFSAVGTNYILAVDVDSPPTNDMVMVSNGVAISAGGTTIREENLIPASIGGIGDAYDNFDFVGITETGGYMITGDSDAATTADEFVMIDSQIVLREGDMIEASTLSGAIESAFMNEDGDWAAIWDADIGPANLEVLIVNGEIILTEGEAVDWNGDGKIDGMDNGAVLDDFNGISFMTMSQRDAMGNVRVYFVADADVEGSTVEAGFEFVHAVDKIIKGDVNGDGLVNLLDVQAFIDAISGAIFIPEADINMDGVVDLLDVAPFVALLSGD